MEPLFSDDRVVFGLLMVLLGLVFYTASSNHSVWQAFYRFVPPLFLCYFLPGILNSVGVISAEKSGLPQMASAYLLPAALVLLTLSLDFGALKRLGGKAVIIFLTGTVGIIIGGPIALAVTRWISPDSFTGTEADAVWRGMSTIAGSWIGGGANQAAMRDIFQPSPALFSIMIAVDVVVANLLMAALLFSASRNEQINRFLKADTTALEAVRERLRQIHLEGIRATRTDDLIKMGAAAFGAVAFAHWAGGLLGPFFKENFPQLDRFSFSSTFFWMVLIVSALGIVLSFTPLRKLEGAGASKLGTVLLYVLVTTIGMQMDITAIFRYPIFFLMGIIWLSVHVLLLFLVTRWLKVPLFFAAVGSQANVGGAASAPVVASAFDPALAPVGALLAVLGYAIGTYGAYVSGLIMQAIY